MEISIGKFYLTIDSLLKCVLSFFLLVDCNISKLKNKMMNVTDFTFIFRFFFYVLYFWTLIAFHSCYSRQCRFFSSSCHYRNKISMMMKKAVVDEPLQTIENGDNIDEKQSIW
jgi:hypothetical protein